jgi:poly(3-hydroxybutyrate) depolymerase
MSALIHLFRAALKTSSGLALVAFWACAQNVQQVEVRDHPGQSYAMFVPSNYRADQAWPIVYCLDPGARGRVPVERFAAAAEKAGFLVAGSNNSRNGAIAPSREAIGFMVQDTHERYAIDDARIYAAGLSGGARLALAWAVGQNGRIAGVIACSAGFGSETPKQLPFKLFATAGVDDFNHDELYRMSRDLARHNVPHRFVEFEGGHEWMPAALAAEAFGFFAGTVPAQAATASKEAERQAADYDRFIAQIQGSDAQERDAAIRQLQKDAAREQDVPARRVARRVIGGISIGSMEAVREFMAQKRYSDAARTAETAVMLRPENAGGWYSLAVTQAANGDTRRAIESLENAVAKGFRGWQRAGQEALLVKVRRDPRFAALLEKMKN